jgi:uncharacterized protein (TIGR03437 family)
VSPGQISAIAPYSLAAARSVRITVEHNGVRSPLSEVAVLESAPGIFKVGGTSQGAIINQNGSVNGIQAMAPVGSIVSIYATGEGLLAPAVAEGTHAGSDTLLRPLLPVAVQVGGVDAEVLYAGSAPGLLVGVLQVNARISQATPRGPDVPVVLTIGPNRSAPATAAIQ